MMSMLGDLDVNGFNPALVAPAMRAFFFPSFMPTQRELVGLSERRGMNSSASSGYEICHLDKMNSPAIAIGVTATYAVSLSGGLASAISAERVIQRYGR